MTPKAWHAFCDFKNDFLLQCKKYSAYSEKLSALTKCAAEKDTPPYTIENAIVYNRALDDISENDEISYIVVADNPGKDEQRSSQCRYLVGHSGKLAERFFNINSALDANFRKNVIILNKTPIHTAKTQHLYFLAKTDDAAAALIDESQKWLAVKTAELHQTLVAEAVSEKKSAPELWLVGYAELKAKKIFSPYRDALVAAYKNESTKNAAWDRVKVFQHFSMNRFSIDLKKWQSTNYQTDITKALSTLGDFHKREIFGE